MSTTVAGPPTAIRLPTHLDLPDSDGIPVDNTFQVAEYGLLEAVRPTLFNLHQDGQFLVACDVGIYWRITDPPLDGCKAPDWFYVPNVPPMLGDDYRRSYVMWQEHIAPTLIIEFVSGDGRAERDTTPMRGKLWIYERAIHATYYAIYDPDDGEVELYKLDDGRYRRVAANERGRYPIPPMDVELGTWRAKYRQITADWLRFFDKDGVMLPCGEERAEMERQNAERERQAAARERQNAERLAAKLRELGVDPGQV